MKPSEERAAGLPPFAELKARLDADWKVERREKDALAQLEPAAKELSSGTTLAALATRYGTEVKTTTEFGPGGPVPELGTAPELTAAVFQTTQGQAGPAVAVPNGFVLFRVLTRTEGDRGAFEAQKEQLRESHPQPRGRPPDARVPPADARRAQGRGQRAAARLVHAGHGGRATQLIAGPAATTTIGA